MSDFKSNEYAALLGGADFEPEEENPMIGLRGASRYHSEQFAGCFALVITSYSIHYTKLYETGFALRGRVPAAIESGELERCAGLAIDTDNAQVMICGNPAMVHDTVEVLEARGLKKNRRNNFV